jgi:hypothetical protein
LNEVVAVFIFRRSNEFVIRCLGLDSYVNTVSFLSEQGSRSPMHYERNFGDELCAIDRVTTKSVVL